MSARGVIRRLKAHEAGRPLPNGETIHFPIADDQDLMLLAFVRMGGESRPWGIGYGLYGEEPELLVVPEARDRDLVAAMAEKFAPRFLTHLHHPEFDEWDEESEENPPLRQVWLPNPAHVQMLHFLNYTYTFAGRGGDDEEEQEKPERILRLNALGRAAGWAFRESQRAGNVTVMDASAALRGAYTFPADDLRQQHLGFLLAWLGTAGDRAAREAAAELAERASVSTTLDPKIERDELEPRVDRYRDADRAGDDPEKAAATAEIEEIVAAELRRRLDLCTAAVALLRAEDRPTNPGVAELAGLARDQFVYGYLRGERPGRDGRPAFVPSPETDRNVAGAASGYLMQVYAAELQAEALIHHDRELQAEAIAGGDAFRGRIVKVEDWAPHGSKGKTPVWTIESDGEGPLRLREGSRVCVAGMPSRDGVIRTVSPMTGGRQFEVEILGWKRARPTDPKFPGLLAAHDTGLTGDDVTFLSSSGVGFSERKRFLVWAKDGPGAWLTHQNGARPGAAGGGVAGDPLAAVEALRGAG